MYVHIHLMERDTVRGRIQARGVGEGEGGAGGSLLGRGPDVELPGAPKIMT